MVTVSVIMGIYNCATTLEEAIDSIVNQTFTDWELIMCDDGSQDNTLEVALKYKEKYPEKIVVLKNEKNIGLNATLNKCLAVAKGKYIARMDGDDVCSPERFVKELAVLENEPEIAIVSTDMAYFDESGTWGKISHPHTHKALISYMKHLLPCTMYGKKEAYDAVQGYSVDKKLLRVEDYHLWMNMYRAGYKGKNIGEILYSMRDDRNAYNRRKFRYRLNSAYVICLTIKELELPMWGYVRALRPIIVGLLPNFLYDKLHKWNLRGKK